MTAPEESLVAKKKEEEEAQVKKDYALVVAAVKEEQDDKSPASPFQNQQQTKRGTQRPRSHNVLFTPKDRLLAHADKMHRNRLRAVYTDVSIATRTERNLLEHELEEKMHRLNLELETAGKAKAQKDHDRIVQAIEEMTSDTNEE